MYSRISINRFISQATKDPSIVHLKKLSDLTYRKCMEEKIKSAIVNNFSALEYKRILGYLSSDKISVDDIHYLSKNLKSEQKVDCMKIVATMGKKTSFRQFLRLVGQQVLYILRSGYCQVRLTDFAYALHFLYLDEYYSNKMLGIPVPKMKHKQALMKAQLRIFLGTFCTRDYEEQPCLIIDVWDNYIFDHAPIKKVKLNGLNRFRSMPQYLEVCSEINYVLDSLRVKSDEWQPPKINMVCTSSQLYVSSLQTLFRKTTNLSTAKIFKLIAINLDDLTVLAKHPDIVEHYYKSISITRVQQKLDKIVNAHEYVEQFKPLNTFVAMQLFSYTKYNRGIFYTIVDTMHAREYFEEYLSNVNIDVSKLDPNSGEFEDDLMDLIIDGNKINQVRRLLTKRKTDDMPLKVTFDNVAPKDILRVKHIADRCMNILKNTYADKFTYEIGSLVCIDNIRTYFKEGLLHKSLDWDFRNKISETEE